MPELNVEFLTSASSANSTSSGIWLGFVGHCADHASTLRANAYEDAVLALLPRHGGSIVVRAQRAEEQPENLPAEMHIIYFPSRRAYEDFVADRDRHALISSFGDVFTHKSIVELKPPTIKQAVIANEETRS